MALWGGRFKLEQKSVTHRDYDEPGEGLRADVERVPPGVFVGKFGTLANETTTVADYQRKTRVDNPAYSLKLNFRLPKPLRCDDIQWEQIVTAWSEDPRDCTSEVDMTSTSPEVDLAEHAPCTWPPDPTPEWCLPDSRQPYHPFTNLRLTGQRERLTSTYTEDLGTVRPGEIADVSPPPPGLQPWGIPLLNTQYDAEFSAAQLRPKGYHHPHLHPVRPRRQLCPRWETSYHAMCRETLEAPSWVKDFLVSNSHQPPSDVHVLWRTKELV